MHTIITQPGAGTLVTQAGPASVQVTRISQPGQVPLALQTVVLAAETRVHITSVEAAQELVRLSTLGEVGPQGPPGPPGVGVAGQLQAIAGANLSGHRAVRVDGGVADYADPADGRVAGITTGAASAGNLITVQIDGVLTEPSWSWAPGQVWLGPAGTLTQVPPTAGAMTRVGQAVSPTALQIDLQPPILRVA